MRSRSLKRLLKVSLSQYLYTPKWKQTVVWIYKFFEWSRSLNLRSKHWLDLKKVGDGRAETYYMFLIWERQSNTSRKRKTNCKKLIDNRFSTLSAIFHASRFKVFSQVLTTDYSYMQKTTRFYMYFLIVFP